VSADFVAELIIPDGRMHVPAVGDKHMIITARARPGDAEAHGPAAGFLLSVLLICAGDTDFVKAGWPSSSMPAMPKGDPVFKATDRSEDPVDGASSSPCAASSPSRPGRGGPAPDPPAIEAVPVHLTAKDRARFFLIRYPQPGAHGG